MSERIDIFNANFNPIGSMDRGEAHEKGAWHSTIHCWVVNGSINGGSILVQLRGANVKAFPNMFDISAAGHIRSGEDLDQAVREVDEELGVIFNQDDLHFLGYRIEANDWEEGNQINREYAATFMLRCDCPLSDYTPQIEEVEGLFWLPVSDAFKLFSNNSAQVLVEGIRLNQFRNGYSSETRIVKKEDFVPRIQNLYLTIAIMAERLLEGRYPIAVS